MSLHDHAAAFGDMVPHLETLSRFASRASCVVEFGVRSGVSTWALLDGLPKGSRLISVDVSATDLPERITHDKRWTFVLGDDRSVDLPQGYADLVFIDTSHEYHHTLAELDIAASLRAEWILLHDYALPDVHDAVHGWLSRNPGYRLALIEPSQWALAGLERVP